MTRFILLIQFIVSLTGRPAESCPVNNCYLDSCINNTCSKCDGSYFLTDQNECSQCYLSCRECNGERCYTCPHTQCDSCIDNCTCSSNNVTCSTCPEGYYMWGNKCYKCHFHKCKCTDIFGCTGCLPGYYGSSSLCQRCPPNCLICSSSNDCSECVSGKYGTSCQTNCSNLCNDRTCNKISGTCTDKCAEGQYLENGTTCKLCPGRCKTCTNFISCTTCKKYFYWGKACEYDCFGCYGSCDRNHGCSSGCDDFYYNWYDEGKKGYICTRCPEHCVECSNSTLCSSCNPVHWGSYCQYNCSGCSNSCHVSEGCTAGCVVGYYKHIIDGGFQCGKCPAYCSICRNNTLCEVCDDEYYLSDGLYCIPCPKTCVNKSCNKNDGSCLQGCKDNWSGWHCNETCPSNCKQCDQFCNSCKIGFHGDKCERSCSLQCKEIDGLQTCSKANGVCLQGCKAGYWGQICDSLCEKGCNSDACNGSTGDCLNGCKGNYFGIHCKSECNYNCQIDTQTSRQCHIFSGICDNGCQNGWFGTNCTEKCNTACKEAICFQNNGTCAYDHADDNIGFITTTVFGERQGYSEPSQTDGNLTVLVGVGAGAAIVTALVIVVTVLIIRYRRATKNREQSEGAIDVVEDNNNPRQGDVTYATVNKQLQTTINIVDDNSRQCKNDVTYAAVNKKKPALETLPETIILNDKSSVVMSNATGNVVAEDVITDLKQNNKTEIDSVRADALQDIKIKRKPTSNLSKQNQFQEKKSLSKELDLGKASKDALLKKESEEILLYKNDIVEKHTTYYNTISKRVPVSGLAELIKSKDHNAIEKEFQKLPKGLQKEHVVAQNPRNAAKNRYKQIYPYDESRVVLKDGGNDYVNASFIKGHNRPRAYIASSGPFQKGKNDNQTESDLWRMVWQEQCETIVMLTKCYENEEQKCEQYWPELGRSKQHGSLNVTCVTEDQYADFIIRSFIVNKDGQNLNTRHLQFTAWPDKGVPADVTSMIEFRQKVRSLHKDAVCPMLVHCSAGIGRTGTFIALDIQTNIGESSGYVDLFACVSELRNQRVNLVQTPEQYVYLHHAVFHALTFDSQSILAEKFIETYSRMIKKNEGQSRIQRQFLKLQSTIDEISAEDKKAMDQNRAFTDKNRNGADIPGDENRIILHGNTKPGSPNYINAVYINGFRSRNNFIAAQIPLPTTLVDFLSLIVQEKCSKVVMMEEVDTQNKTVGVFWPADNQVLKHGVFQVRCKGSKTSQTYKLKELSIESRTGKTAEKLDVDLYIYTDWPKEVVVPQSSDSLLQLIKDVGTHNCQQEKDVPVLILCMTGAERSCLFCAVSVLIEKMEIEHEVSVVNTLRQIKARRRSAIPTLEQYKFCHQAVMSYLQTFDIYSNFGLKEKEAN